MEDEMKKIFFTSFILTLILIFAPAFLFNNIERKTNKVVEVKLEKSIEKQDEDLVEAVFASKDCFKQTYYIANSSVDIYENCGESPKIVKKLYKNDVVVAYMNINGYLYCEDNEGKFGWIKNSSNNIISKIDKETEYVVDTSITKQVVNIYRNGEEIKSFKCSTGLIGDQDNETPIGVFFIQVKGNGFFSEKYGEGAKYYIKFFSNYLFHSIPIDRNGNIIEEEEKRLGEPASHGCIRLSMEDIKWMYDNIPQGSKVNIHY